MRSTVFAAVAAAVVSLAGPAHAGGLGCGLNAVQPPSAQSATGSMTGGPYSDTGNVSIRCYVRVNGVERSGTPTGTGTGAASTAGPVAFAASDTDHVEACTDTTNSVTSATYCFAVPPVVLAGTTYWQLPQPAI